MYRDIVLILSALAIALAGTLIIQIVYPHEVDAGEPVPILKANDIMLDSHYCHIPVELRDNL